MNEPSQNMIAVILAAGQGKRMKSKRPKVLHQVAGKPMIRYALDLVAALGVERTVVVLGHHKELVCDLLSEDIRCGRVQVVEQQPLMGTAHAVLMTHSLLGHYAGNLLILNGDHPLLRPQTLERLVRSHADSGAALSLLTAHLREPHGYGRIIRDAEGALTGIVEDRDATVGQREITEINVGVYVARADVLFDLLQEIKPENAQGEFYLPDSVRLAFQKGLGVLAVAAEDSTEVLGINSRAELAAAEKAIRRRATDRLLREGVTILDPDHTVIDDSVRIGQDTIIYPFSFIEGESRIGESCVIASHVRIRNSHLEDRVEVRDHCVIVDSSLESEATVGPFAHLRPGTRIRKRARIGNFVEVKKSVLGEGSKANHLSYLGDAVIGKGVNIGAGTITCNYDGKQKAQTIIEDDVFVGSDTQFIAPVKVGRGAVIGAGSTITDEVPADSLAVARPRQTIKKGWAKRRRNPSSRRAAPGKKKKKG